MYGSIIDGYDALKITFISMFIVFITLTLIYFSLKILRRVISLNRYKKDVIEEKVPKEVLREKTITKEELSENELIAVITSAIATSSGKHYSKIKVKSIKRVK